MATTMYSRVFILRDRKRGHRRGVKTHALDCWFVALNMHEIKYDEVDAAEVATYPACKHCGGGRAVTPP